MPIIEFLRTCRPTTGDARRAGGARLLPGALLGFCTTMLTTPPCGADTPSPNGEITVGPSIAWGFGTKRQRPVLLGAEFSYLPGGPFWATLGGRALLAESGTAGLLHLEAGVWLFATLGLGYSRRLWGDAFDGNNLHLFVGAPLPFAEAFDAGMLFAEPYYRPGIGLASGSVVHELGLMLKFTTYQ